MKAVYFDPAEEIRQLDELCLDDLVLMLRAEGCKGRRGSVQECPVANYLRKQSGLSQADAYVLVGSMVTWVMGQVFVTPPSVRLFTDLFDTGRYPELEGEPLLNYLARTYDS